MVKVFLEESAELCIERLGTLIEEDGNYRIVCPSEAFIEKLVEFYPHVADKNLRTVSQFISELGYRPIPNDIANIIPDANPFIDPTVCWMDYVKTLSEAEKTSTKAWLKEAGFVTLEDIPKTSSNFCKTCLFFGPFDSGLLNELQNYLKPFFEDFCAIRRRFKTNFNRPLTRIKGYSVRNIQQEREYIRNTHKENTNFIVCYPELWLDAFPMGTNLQQLQWIDYQGAGTLGYVLPYLYTSIKDKEDRNSVIKSLQNAQRCCSREDLFALKAWLLQQDETKPLPFTHLNWPVEAPLESFVRLLNTCDGPLKLPQSLETCPINFTRRQFFSYLRRNGKHYSLEHLTPWEEALYLPIKDGCFLHGISEAPEIDQQRLCWFEEVENRGGTLVVVIPEKDEKGMSYSPLIPVAKKAEDPTQKSENFDTSQEFILPKSRLSFSCKNWERYRLSPVKTWLDSVLKAKKFDLIQPRFQARICGEWVHENLEFETQPENLEAWQDSISKKAKKRWQMLRTIFGEKMPNQLQQWHSRTYRLSLQMAQACGDLLDGSWRLQSEYVLPKNAQYSGRIDLLATRHQEAIIVDFKTAVDYTFTPGKLNKGHGLQLLLYGRTLEPYYEHIQLRVINGNCSNLTLDLREISPEVCTIEAWLEAIKNSGIYINLPEEKEETLPLCWR